MPLPSHEPWAPGRIARINGVSGMTTEVYRQHWGMLERMMLPENFAILAQELMAAEVANAAIVTMMNPASNVLDAGATED